MPAGVVAFPPGSDRGQVALWRGHDAGRKTASADLFNCRIDRSVMRGIKKPPGTGRRGAVFEPVVFLN